MQEISRSHSFGMDALIVFLQVWNNIMKQLLWLVACKQKSDGLKTANKLVRCGLALGFEGNVQQLQLQRRAPQPKLKRKQTAEPN